MKFQLIGNDHTANWDHQALYFGISERGRGLSVIHDLVWQTMNSGRITEFGRNASAKEFLLDQLCHLIRDDEDPGDLRRPEFRDWAVNQLTLVLETDPKMECAVFILDGLEDGELFFKRLEQSITSM
jgi:hypothetical protein